MITDNVISAIHHTDKDIYLAHIKTCLTRIMTKFRGSFKNSHTNCAWYIKMILSQYPCGQPTSIFVRQSISSSGTRRDTQYVWLRGETEHFQSFVNRKNMKKVQSALDTIYQKSREAATLFSAYGNTRVKMLWERWSEHFSDVFNRPSNIMTMLSTDSQSAMFCLVNFQLSLKQDTQSDYAPDVNAFMSRSLYLGASHRRETYRTVSQYVEEGSYPTII